MARFEETGVVPREIAAALGLGPAARASGLERDVRRDHPGGIYPLPPDAGVAGRVGDVFARA